MTEIRGDVEDGYGPIVDAFAANFAEHGDVGAGFALYVDGAPVVDITAGIADRSTGAPYDDQTLQLVFSTTKGAAALCAAMLHQEGRLDYDAPVAHYWPEFATGGKDSLTVGQMMSHQGGLVSVDNPPSRDEVLKVDPIVKALAAQSPLWEFDGSHGYHALTYGWLVGEVVRRITGQRLGEWFQDNVAKPLGLDFWIGLPASEEPRVAPLIGSPPPDDPIAAQLMEAVMGPGTLAYRALSLDGIFSLEEEEGNVFNTPEVRASEIPAANGVTNAASLARMYAATLGEVDGVRLIDDATRDHATTIVTSGNDRCLVMETKFAMGFMCDDGILPLTGPRAFGHAGAGGSIAFADPDLGIGYGYVMNQMSNSLVGDPRTTGLTDAVKLCVS